MACHVLIKYWIAVSIKREWTKKAINKMKSGEASRPSGIVVKVLKTSGETGIDLLMELANSLVNEGVVPGE